MQTHHDAAPARPTADWIHHYAADLLAAAPGMHPLDAVRLALEVTEGAAEPGREPPARAAVPSPARRREP
jgi:hypothetical protein